MLLLDVVPATSPLVHHACAAFLCFSEQRCSLSDFMSLLPALKARQRFLLYLTDLTDSASPLIDYRHSPLLFVFLLQVLRSVFFLPFLWLPILTSDLLGFLRLHCPVRSSPSSWSSC
eukprot:RCo001600